jgi:hypothetical protein
MSNTQILNLTGAYDPKNVKLYIGGQRVYGYAPDTKISMSRNGDNITNVVGTDGEASAALNRDRSGIMTVSLQQTSGFNSYLMAWQRQADSTGLVWLPILLEGSQGVSVSSFCNISKQPDFSYTSDVNQLDWEFFVHDLWYAPSSESSLIGAAASLIGAV